MDLRCHQGLQVHAAVLAQTSTCRLPCSVTRPIGSS